MSAAKKTARRPRIVKRARIEIGFEVERDTVFSREEMDAAFQGALDAVLTGARRTYYHGSLRSKLVRIRRP
ncbi:MAG TPA: hypothetical protein VGI39_04820 [Polyangiaceae bacterium]|jgi:hypothetical protein